MNTLKFWNILRYDTINKRVLVIKRTSNECSKLKEKYSDEYGEGQEYGTSSSGM